MRTQDLPEATAEGRLVGHKKDCPHIWPTLVAARERVVGAADETQTRPMWCGGSAPHPLKVGRIQATLSSAKCKTRSGFGPVGR